MPDRRPRCGAAIHARSARCRWEATVIDSGGITAVGIAGGSGAGKTTVMERIANTVGTEQIVTLCLDNYYRDLRHLTSADRAAFNFDEPTAFDVPTFVNHLKALKN